MFRSTMIRRRFVPALAAVLLVAAGNAAAGPVSKAFTYQGQLQVGGQPANGLFDIRFELHGAPGAVNLLGTIERTNVEIENGLITTQLNFGDSLFSGDERWLQIAVRPAGSGDYTVLSPRQGLTAAPYASGLAGPIYSAGASSATRLAINQDGEGEAGAFYVNSASNGNSALAAGTSGTGFGAYVWSINQLSLSPALNAVHTGRGPAGRFTTNSNAGSSAALEAINQGIGSALKATSHNIGAGVHAVTLSQTTGSALAANSHGSVNTIAASVAHYSQGTALRATTGGSGTAVDAIQTGSGTAIRADAGNGLGLWASTTGVGTAIRATAQGPAGMGVYASVTGNGTAVRAATGAGGTSLMIEGGSIRVGGAGINTQSAVFRHRITSASITGCIGAMCKLSKLDHPMLNGNPNAMVFITEVVTSLESAARTVPVAVHYQNGYWHLKAQGDSIVTILEDFDVGQEFNVMVILPM